MLNVLRPLLLIAIVALALPAWAEEASAQRTEVGERIREVERDGGRVLRAERIQRGGQDVYRIKVLTPEGRVRVLHDRRPVQDRAPPRTDRRSLMLRDRANRPAQRAPAPEADVREPAPRAASRQDD
ncbi:PepSY domain-containing protein [Arenimonas aestuarii]